MKLHFSKDWLRKKINKMEKEGIEEPGVMGAGCVTSDYNRLDSLLTLLAGAPNDQIDHLVKEQLASLIGRDQQTVKLALKDILDQCVHGALCTDFTIAVLDTMLNMDFDDD
jgi:hypothetical protein